MQDHRKPRVWNRSMELTEAVYASTSALPDSERHGLSAQMRRAATSIPANIVEGCGRDGTRELIRFVGIAMGSASELETHIEIAVRVGVMSPNAELLRRVRTVKRGLYRFREALKNEIATHPP